MKRGIKLPSFMVRDDRECVRIAAACGLDMEMPRMAREQYARTGIAQMVATTATLGNKVYAFQFFEGFEGDSQNGWLIFGYDSVEHFFLHLPHLLEQFHEIGKGPYLSSYVEESCKN